MAIDLITGHQGVSHISADQIATINNAMMDNFGANKVMRLVGGELTADGLTITISEGYWRVNGFDMEIQEGETLYIDPTTIGLSRIDDIYVEILQDIPTGAQRAEIYIALGEPSATPTAPDEPTAPYLNTDILLQIIKLARVTVSEGAMIMEDYSVAYNIVTPEDLAEVQTEVDTAENHATTALNQIADSDDTYSPSKAYKVGEHCIYNNVLYKCITACSAAAWSVNQNCFEPTTLTTAVTELNSALLNNYKVKTCYYKTTEPGHITPNTSRSYDFNKPDGYTEGLAALVLFNNCVMPTGDTNNEGWNGRVIIGDAPNGDNNKVRVTVVFGGSWGQSNYKVKIILFYI